jgi:acyl dehydratase
MQQPTLYFDDFAIGSSTECGRVTASESEIRDFATRFDPQPFHVDPVAASGSIFGGIIASGWHTCSMMMRLAVDGYLHQTASLGSPGVDEVRWLKPVRAGDVLTMRSTVLDAIPSTSRPDRGVIYSLWEAFNQHGELVTTVKGRGMMLRRPS